MNRISRITLLSLAALACATSLTNCEAAKAAGTKVKTAYNSLTPETRKAALVAVSKATAIAVADLVKGNGKAALGDAAGSVLDSIHAQAKGNPALVVIDAAGHEILLDALKKQGVKETLSDAGIAGLNALVNGQAMPVETPPPAPVVSEPLPPGLP